jgi:hypothetical protein
VRLNNARQDKTRQDKTRQDKTRQGKKRQDKTGQDKTRQEKTRQGKIEERSKINTRYDTYKSKVKRKRWRQRRDGYFEAIDNFVPFDGEKLGAPGNN